MKANNATNYAITVDGELKSYSESRWQAFVEKTVKEGKPAPTPERVQTFVVYEAETPADFAELAPNDEVSVSLWNRGSSLKQATEIREIMEDASIELSEAPYDLKDVINRVPERRSATPESKIETLLGKLDPDALARVMAKLLEAQTAPRV